MGRFINADSFASTGQGLLGYNVCAYCNNNPNNFSDYSGNIPVLAWGYLGAGVVCGIANVFPVARTGGTINDCISAFAVGAAGGVIGFGVAHAMKFTVQGAIAGRAVSSVVCDIGTPLAISGSVSEREVVLSAVDIIMDSLFSTISYYYTEPIAQKIRYFVDPAIDGFMDNIESYLFYEKPTSTGTGNGTYTPHIPGSPGYGIGGNMHVRD